MSTLRLIPEDGILDVGAVELAVEGARVRLTPTELRAAINDMHARRYSDLAIAEILGCSDDAVRAIRRELGLPTVPRGEQQQWGSAA